MTDTPAPSVPTSPTVARPDDGLREALSWALDILDMTDERLIKLGDPRERVYSEIHLAAKAKARNALKSAANLCAPPSVLPTESTGPAVSPEIDALIDDVRDALRVTDDGQALASLAAVRTEVARLTKERDEAMRESLARVAETWRRWDDLQAQIRRLQQEALTDAERDKLCAIIEDASAIDYGDLSAIHAKLRTWTISGGSAHKEKEWARSSDISGKEKE